MEASFGLFVVVLGLLYFAFLLIMWNVRSFENQFFKIMLLLTIMGFCLMAGSYGLLALWGLNLMIQLVTLGSLT
ncbi:hypothetical protein A3K29_05025 [Candidatus Collierbacteria bacterium RIFOXYB2_FULL_46_14]|uniref:Uncharacterized protein n=1 Tax=Candidatus Collierbacteria bacterium GW2011_GWA2_46_26 TaxID=1618381 RepID=A0A0G1SI94_9BACT|nr:MAG: hypothetical protein UX47_C0006G0031 [Candidatus Collierbacteria bacterium GW2011_GWA2_46_26]OGD73459.1 MAG: hypothetical protein A3K29_05025 [Candidatus Collierbacteria bacterium RIFOXYB2_FULL_46_14]OGD76501.1 MAG: hypothetical protein A3K43_05025 [Candidatus Collierbacteria bacterium RIFOXYA2_FULL_46_20]OGD77837.1 MAG: hypothetical protein A3K39_05025 [Candidatus Collierbacteria bacterium RIFOXYC2_FULL_43_15]OGD81128.1 MAG: hypothetical protein A2320_05525 [Pseudomonadales bacterium G